MYDTEICDGKKKNWSDLKEEDGMPPTECLPQVGAILITPITTLVNTIITPYPN